LPERETNWGTNICTRVRKTTAWPPDDASDHIIEALVEEARSTRRRSSRVVEEEVNWAFAR